MNQTLQRFLFVACVFAAVFAAENSVRWGRSDAAQTRAATLVGWRLPTKIVITGDFAGAAQLRELAGEIEFQSDAKISEEGDATPLMRAIVSMLSGMTSGRIEIADGQASIIAIVAASGLEKFRRDAQSLTSSGVKVAQLRLGSSDATPFQWTAVRYKDEYGSDTIELAGVVVNEEARARLIAIARSLSDKIVVIDKMSIDSAQERKIQDAEKVGLAQLRPLSDGLFWMADDKFSLYGSSIDVSLSDKNRGCAALATVMPSGVACGNVQIVRARAWRRHHAHRGGGGDSEEVTAPKSGPFVAQRLDQRQVEGVLEESSDPRVVDILFATLRKRESGDAAVTPIFSGERASELSYGRSRVRIPEDHKIGRLELPGGLSIFGIKLTQEVVDPKKHFILRSREPLTLEQWDALIDKLGPTDAVVFVHGFNTSFDDGIFRFAQIVWDLQYRGLPVLFSWASKGQVIDYQYDRESALDARDAFLNVLANLREKHGIATVHVIAHSMGNFLVLDALAHQGGALNNTLGQLVMAAPDVDRDQFVQDIPKIKPFFRGLTLYASSADKALALSKHVAGGIPRAGDVPTEGPIVLPGLETLDVTLLGEEMFGLNHTTFAQARPLIDDIQLILSEGRHAPRLAQERPFPENVTPPRYWRFAP